MQHPEANQHKGSQKASGLKHVGEHQRAYSATASIRPNQRHHQCHGQDKVDAKRLKYQFVEQHAHNIEFQRGSNEFAHNEKRCSGDLTFSAETLAKIGVDAG